MEKNFNISFMAFAGGRTAEPTFERKFYVGAENIFIDKINPTLKELQEMFPNNPNIAEPVYVTDVPSRIDPNKMVKQVTIDIYYSTAPETVGHKIFGHKRHSILMEPFKSSTKGTFQVIDGFGRSGWASEEDIANHRVPVYSNGQPANLNTDFRKAFRGEVELTEFVKTYLRVPSIQVWDAETRTFIPNKNANPEECLARFDTADIMNFFKGDFKALKEVIAIQPMNQVKVLFCVRTATDGKQYQDILFSPVLDCRSNSYKVFDKYIEDQRTNNRLTNYDFYNAEETGVSALHEFIVTTTSFTPSEQPVTEELPF